MPLRLLVRECRGLVMDSIDSQDLSYVLSCEIGASLMWVNLIIKIILILLILCKSLILNFLLLYCEGSESCCSAFN